MAFRRMIVAIVFVLSGTLSGINAHASGDDIRSEMAETMQEYTEFAEFTQGVILPSQVDDGIAAAALFIDARREEDFSAGHIESAKHIDWRELIGRRDELPDSGPVIVYCQTGVLSAQAVFGLRVLGHDNVLVLQGGFDAWKIEKAQ